jgi:hypothetical protein
MLPSTMFTKYGPLISSRWREVAVLYHTSFLPAATNFRVQLKVRVKQRARRECEKIVLQTHDTQMAVIDFVEFVIQSEKSLPFRHNLSRVDARRSDGTRIFTDATEKHGSQLSVRIRVMRENPCPIRASLEKHSLLVAAEGLRRGIRRPESFQLDAYSTLAPPLWESDNAASEGRPSKCTIGTRTT